MLKTALGSRWYDSSQDTDKFHDTVVSKNIGNVGVSYFLINIPQFNGSWPKKKSS